jgi:hypothetical protein
MSTSNLSNLTFSVYTHTHGLAKLPTTRIGPVLEFIEPFERAALGGPPLLREDTHTIVLPSYLGKTNRTLKEAGS